MSRRECACAFLGGLVGGLIVGPPAFYLFFLHVPRKLTPH